MRGHITNLHPWLIRLKGIAKAALLQNEIAAGFFKQFDTKHGTKNATKMIRKRPKTCPKYSEPLSCRLKVFHLHFSKNSSLPKTCTKPQKLHRDSLQSAGLATLRKWANKISQVGLLRSHLRSSPTGRESQGISSTRRRRGRKRMCKSWSTDSSRRRKIFTCRRGKSKMDVNKTRCSKMNCSNKNCSKSQADSSQGPGAEKSVRTWQEHIPSILVQRHVDAKTGFDFVPVRGCCLERLYDKK